jgi:glycerophosphoryl diester phosphodiesterase
MNTRRLAAPLCAILMLPLMSATASAGDHAASEPIVIGHRGGAGHRPDEGHRPRALTGWFTEDFTLAELRTLRAKERIPAIRQRNTIYDGRYRVPTFQGVIDLVKRLSRELGRPIGISPETKHPSYFRSIGLALEEPLVAALRANKLNRRGAKVFVQSCEVHNLQALNRVLDVPLVQLFGAPSQRPADDSRTYAELATANGLAGVARYADSVGPSKNYIVPRRRRRVAGADVLRRRRTSRRASRSTYTFRNENTFLALELHRSADPVAWGNPLAEYAKFYAPGGDGVFPDYPDTTLDARDGPVD